MLSRRASVLILAMGFAGLAAATPAGAQDPPRPGTDSLVARGNEPFWRMTLGQSGVRLEAPDPALAFSSDSLGRRESLGPPRLIATTGGRTLAIEIHERLCADTMTGMPFPVEVRLDLDGRVLTGCGGETMTAIEGGWRVIRLEEDLPPDGAVITLVFGRDGRVAGRAACNRFSGAYTLTAEGLTFGALAATRMACPPPLMDTERRVFDLLARVDRITTGDPGQLRLMAADRVVLVLDRAH